MGNPESPEHDAADPLIGRVIDARFQLEKRLGAGAMGAVYRARHVHIGRKFALKILHADLLDDAKLKRRFVREAELAGTLSHSNIVKVTDVGETPDGLHYIAMEYAEGPTLGEIIARDAPVPAPRVITLVAQILDGLHHAHKHGLIHRDFKPDNVIIVTELDGKESPRIVDFGIAIVRDDASSAQRERLTTAGITLGTPHYMAPEHVTGQAIDHRIDLFAVGVVLYEMLCGRMPFEGDGVDVARANLLEQTPSMAERAPMVEVDPLLEAFTRKLMSKAPDARPASAKDARALLDSIARDRMKAGAALGITIEDAAAPAPVPRYGKYTPPTPFLAVSQPVTYSPSGQHAIVEAMRDPTGPVPVAIAAAASSRTRSPRVSQEPLRAESPLPSTPLPRALSQPGLPLAESFSTPLPSTLPYGSQPGSRARPNAEPQPKSQPIPVATAPRRNRRMWIMIAAALAALALGALLAVLLS